MTPLSSHQWLQSLSLSCERLELYHSPLCIIIIIIIKFFDFFSPNKIPPPKFLLTNINFITWSLKGKAEENKTHLFNMSNLTAPKLPYIRYQCTCQIDNYLNNGTNTENIWPLPDELTLSSLASLYYCNHCSSLKCNYCVQTEPVCYYCPNCLFEVPTATVKAERNR